MLKKGGGQKIEANLLNEDNMPHCKKTDKKNKTVKKEIKVKAKL